MAFFDKVQQVAKSAAAGAGDMIETQKLNMKINDENKKIAAAKVNIGELVWQQHSAGAMVDSQVAEQIAQIKVSLDIIASLEQQIAEVKAGDEPAQPQAAPIQPTMAPPAAPAAAPAGATAFCTACGAKIAAEARFCPNCGQSR